MAEARPTVDPRSQAGAAVGESTIAAAPAAAPVALTIRTAPVQSDSATLLVPARVQLKPEDSVPVVGEGSASTVAALARAAGHYQLEGEIGRGGMSAVYCAFDRDLQRQVAMKVMLPEIQSDPGMEARFVEEAQATAQLQHPGIVPLYEFGHTEGRRLFFTMKLVRGQTLGSVVDLGRSGDREAAHDFSLFRLAQIFVEIARTIYYAHERGVIHRDLKPANIMIGRYGEVHVMDWGLAKVLAPAAGPGGEGPGRGSGIRTSGERTDTVQGSILGTPSYMSPEQAQGRTSQVGIPSDVYGLGAVLYYILTGRPPYTGASPQEVICKILTEPPERPRALDGRVPRELEAICLKAIATSPGDRYPSALALAEDVQAWLEGLPVAACPEGLPRRVLRLARRHRTLTMAVLGVAVLGLLGGSLALSKIGGERRRADAEQAKATVSLARVYYEMGRRALAGRDFLGAQILFVKSLGFEDGRAARERLIEARTRSARLLWTSGPLENSVAVAWTPDGRLVASGDGNLIRVRDASDGRERAVLKGHDAPVYGLSISPKGRWLASASWDRTVRIFDLERAEQAMVLRGHTGKVWGVEYSSDGARIASASEDGTVRVWDAGSGLELLTLRGHKALVYGVAFSPDGKRIASGGWDSTVRVWDAATGASLATLTSHTGWVFRVAFSPDGKLIAGGTDAQRVHVWDAATGQTRFALRGHERGVRDVAFSPSGGRLATASWDQTIRLWDVASGREVMTLRAQESDIEGCGLAFAPDGRRLATGGFQRRLQVWNIERREPAIAFSGHEREVWGLAVSPDGQRIATASRDGTARVFDAEGKELHRLGHGAAVADVAFAPDGRRFVTGAEDGGVRVFDARSGTKLLSLKDHAAQVGTVAFSPTGAEIVTGSDRTILIYDAATGAVRRELRGHEATIGELRWSADGRRIASAAYDHTVRVWDAASGASLAILSGHKHQVEGVDFSSDGRRVASASWDRTIKVWDIERGVELRTLAGHEGSVYSVRFSPDGRTLASASEDGSVRTWDAETGEPRAVLRGHAGEVVAVDFDPGGKYLFSASYDQSVWRWDLESIKGVLERPVAELTAEAERDTGLRVDAVDLTALLPTEPSHDADKKAEEEGSSKR